MMFFFPGNIEHVSDPLSSLIIIIITLPTGDRHRKSVSLNLQYSQHHKPLFLRGPSAHADGIYSSLQCSSDVHNGEFSHKWWHWHSRNLILQPLDEDYGNQQHHIRSSPRRPKRSKNNHTALRRTCPGFRALSLVY